MKLTAIDHGLDLARNTGKRSPGVHMSDLLTPLYADLDPKRYGKKELPPPIERWAIGMAFEEILELGLKNRVGRVAEGETVTRPGEFQTRHTDRCTRPMKKRTPGCGCKCGGGIAFSPDLLIFNGVTRVGEIKCHSMSHKFPYRIGKSYDSIGQKFDKFFSQIMVYAYHLGTPYGRLYPFSLREMVNFNEVKIFTPFDVDFEPVELQETWEWCLDFSVKSGLLT